MESVDEEAYARDLYPFGNGYWLQTHGPIKCGNLPPKPGNACVLHNPTDHHMREWTLIFRPDKQFLAERICEHGVGHPDPDSLARYLKNGQDHMAIHGCDGCSPLKRD